MRGRGIWLVLLLAFLLAGCSRREEAEELQGEETQSSSAEDAGDEDSGWYPRGERIEGQCFDISLEPVGKVTFSSCRPGENAGENADAVFLIEKNGVVWQQLEGMEENNVRQDMKLGQVEAVSFFDGNQDGYDDILLIISYETDQKEDYAEVRLYQGSTTGSFDLERELSRELTEELLSPTIADARLYLRNRSGFIQEADGAQVMMVENAVPPEYQLELILENSDLWKWDEDDTYYMHHYAVTDLDQNGRLEILSASIQGTGQYTYINCYEVNEWGDGLDEVLSDLSDLGFSPDLIQKNLTVYIDRKASVYRYLADDFWRISAAEYRNTRMAVTKKDGELAMEPLVYEEVFASEDSETHLYYQADGTEITKKEYDAFVDSRYEELDKRTARLGWFSPELPLSFYDIYEVSEMLEESWSGFDLY